MPDLPVNAVYSGIQPDGYWTDTPSLIVQLMDHPLSAAPSDIHGRSFPLPEWDLDQANNISLDKLLEIRGSSPRFSYVGTKVLTALAMSYRERHVVIAGRELGHHDIAPVVRPLLDAGRTVQIETTALASGLAIDRAWITLLLLPSRETDMVFQPENAQRPNEVLAGIRWRLDLDRVEAAFAHRKMTVWLMPTETSIYRQCVAVATRHAGWRVTKPGNHGRA